MWREAINGVRNCPGCCRQKKSLMPEYLRLDPMRQVEGKMSGCHLYLDQAVQCSCIAQHLCRAGGVIQPDLNMSGNGSEQLESEGLEIWTEYSLSPAYLFNICPQKIEGS